MAQRRMIGHFLLSSYLESLDVPIGTLIYISLPPLDHLASCHRQSSLSDGSGREELQNGSDGTTFDGSAP